ncbi:MAG: cobalamin-binding protein [Candidatus Acidiferrales bacterium]
MRIVSLIPSATEILFALGLGDEICGVSHECDFPAEARTKRVVVHPRIPEGLAAAEIERRVREYVGRGESLYVVDAAALAEIDADLIITQDLCHVCAATPDDLAAALNGLARMPRILTLDPQSLGDVYGNVRLVAEAAGRASEAERVVGALQNRVAAVERAVAGRVRPRVLCLEWLDPPYPGGHWVPEMVGYAGGIDVLGTIRVPSVPVTWDAVLATQPDIAIIMPCGYGSEKAASEYAVAPLPIGWTDLPAVRAGRVFCVDGSAYYSRSGPRLVDGIEILAGLLHPECADRIAPAPTGAIAPIASAAR